MPLDSFAELTAPQAIYVRDLKRFFGDNRFIAAEAGEVLGKIKSSAAAILSNLAAKGAVFRVTPGVFIMSDPKTLPPPVLDIRPPPPKDDVSKVIIMPGRIKTLAHALAYLKAFRVHVERVGSLFVMDGHFRVTEERLIDIAERRRSNAEKYQTDKPRRLGDLPTSIADPSAKQRIAKR